MNAKGKKAPVNKAGFTDVLLAIVNGIFKPFTLSTIIILCAIFKIPTPEIKDFVLEALRYVIIDNILLGIVIVVSGVIILCLLSYINILKKEVSRLASQRDLYQQKMGGTLLSSEGTS
jgi:hypothetical protein